jgi:DNA topoisomerase-2
MVCSRSQARRGSETRMFLSLAEFKAWQQTPEASAGDWKLKYYKGLGTNTAAEGKEYFSNLLTFRRTFSWSGSADGDEIVKAFGKDQVRCRARVAVSLCGTCVLRCLRSTACGHAA